MYQKNTAMNTTENIFAAIDLGSSKITGVVARKTIDGKLDIIACEQVESKFIRRGEVKNVSDTAFQINEIVRKLENNKELREAKLEIKHVYVGLGGHTLKTITNSVKRVLGKDEEVSKELVSNMFEENFKIQVGTNEIYEVIEQEYFVDDELEYNPVGMFCTHLQGKYKIICGKPELRQNLQRSFERANMLGIAGMYISPIATAQGALSERDKEMGCALIDFGAETTSLNIYFNGYLRHLAVIPFGGSVVTNDIKDLNLTQADAEKLKIQFGNALSQDEEERPKQIIIAPASEGQEAKKVSTAYLSKIIEARMDEILDIVLAEIQKSGFENKLGCGIVITGAASKLKNLNELIKLKTGCDVRFANSHMCVNEYANPKHVDYINNHLIGLLLLADKNCVQPKEEMEASPSNAKVEVKKEKLIKKDKGILGKLGNSLVSLFEGTDTDM